jgi:hypothetical protein
VPLILYKILKFKWNLWERIFHRATNAAGKSGRITGSFVGTHFPSCYKTNDAAGKSGRITGSSYPGSSYPARFPGCIDPVIQPDFPAAFVLCRTMDNAFPQKPCGWPWAIPYGPGFALAALRSGSRALARGPGLAGSGDIDHVRVIQPVAGPGRPYAPRGLEPTTNVVFVGTQDRFPGCICSTMENAFPQNLNML